jgi:hypothetical protein
MVSSIPVSCRGVDSPVLQPGDNEDMHVWGDHKEIRGRSFLKNLQLAGRSFLKILGCVIKLFPELSPAFVFFLKMSIC